MKKVYIEWLRIIAIILVIYNHTRELGYDLYQHTSNTVSFYLSIFMIPICKTAVPIFLMISGTTLLGKTEDYKQLFSKRILKYLGIILFWGSIQYFRYVRTGKVSFSLLTWWKNIYSNPILETYWFLYLYLGFLLLLPLLRKMVMQMSEKEYYYLFILSCINSGLLIIGYFSSCFINSNVFILPSILIFPLLGYGLDNVIYKDKNTLKYGIMIFLSLCIIVPLSLIYLKNTNSYVNFINLIQSFTPILCFGIFGFVKALDTKYIKSLKIKKIIIMLGSTVFGIYLMEDIIRNQIIKLIVHIKTNDFVIAILYTLLTFLTGLIIMLLFQKILFYFKKIPRPQK